MFIVASAGATAASLPPSTWVELTPIPGASDSPIFGLAVNPANDQEVIAGNRGGGIYRSADGGITWTSVHSGKAAILTIAYSPFSPATVVAGTQGGGVLLSTNGGTSWRAGTGTQGRAVRAIEFARSLIVAGTDRGVYTSEDGLAWTQSGLANTSIGAVAVAAVNPPVRIVAGGDVASSGAIPLFQSIDGGTTWKPMIAPISGTWVASLSAGPLPPKGAIRPLVVGTNTGLFTSPDGGATFKALSGGPLLPSTDYTQVSFTATHFDRFYASSDGGGGGQSGGLWATADSGQHFSSLQPPLPSVTALAASGDELPILYVAAFRSSDHRPTLWAYHDTGGTPQGPAPTSAPVATAARTSPSPASLADMVRALASSQVPYVALGAIALLLILLAVVSHFRGRRR